MGKEKLQRQMSHVKSQISGSTVSGHSRSARQQEQQKKKAKTAGRSRRESVLTDIESTRESEKVGGAVLPVKAV